MSISLWYAPEYVNLLKADVPPAAVSTENISDQPISIVKAVEFLNPRLDLFFPSTADDETSTASATSPALIKPSDALFERYAQIQPHELIRLIRGTELAAADLASAAEIAGTIPDSDLVVSALIPLLRDNIPMIREAAIRGLSNHVTIEVERELARLAEEDPSPAIRNTAASILDE